MWIATRFVVPPKNQTTQNMNNTHCMKFGTVLAGVLALIEVSAKADIFGSGGNAFTIDFVNVVNAGNADDAAFDDTAPDYSSPYGGVPYNYRMGTYEISQDAITKATAGGLLNVTSGAWIGSQPATNVSWYEAAAFVNWLNTSTGHPVAYNLDAGATTLTLWSNAQAWQAGGENLYRHKDAYYFLPSEDEWYKAAYHKNDGVTANYWDNATGSNSVPTAVVSGTTAGTAVFNGVNSSPAAVDNDGGLSPYGTRGQDGNALEWQESALDGINDSPSEPRPVRGGYWNALEVELRSSRHYNFGTAENGAVGFRVASVVPEPSSTLLLLGSGWMCLLKRRRTPGL